MSATAHVLMYSTAVCPFCVRAEQLLRARGVADIEKVRVDLDPERRTEMLARPADIYELCKGFGKDVGGRFGDDAWRDQMTEEAFESVCETRPKELSELLEALDSLL